MNRKYRKVLAAILAGVMVMGSGIVANAEEGKGEGAGSLDVVEASDVFSVVLPTDAGTQFDYILDPTGVIAETGAAKYDGATFASGKTMYFANKQSDGTLQYSDESDPIKAYNKSNIAVEIKVQAKLAEETGIKVATSSVAGSASEDPMMYLALKDASSETAITAEGIVATSSITDAAASYKVVYATSSQTYKKELIPAAANATVDDYDSYFQSYSFTLTGDCNENGKWEGLTDVPPTVSLVWSIENTAGSNGPITFTNDGVITLTGLTGSKNFDHKMTLSWDDTTSDNLDSDPNMAWDISQWSQDDGGTLKFTLSDGWVSGLSGKLVTVTVYLNDGSTLTATAQF